MEHVRIHSLFEYSFEQTAQIIIVNNESNGMRFDFILLLFFL